MKTHHLLGLIYLVYLVNEEICPDGVGRMRPNDIKNLSASMEDEPYYIKIGDRTLERLFNLLDRLEKKIPKNVMADELSKYYSRITKQDEDWSLKRFCELHNNQIDEFHAKRRFPVLMDIYLNEIAQQNEHIKYGDLTEVKRLKSDFIKVVKQHFPESNYVIPEIEALKFHGYYTASSKEHRVYFNSAKAKVNQLLELLQKELKKV